MLLGLDFFIVFLGGGEGCVEIFKKKQEGNNT